MGQQQLLLVILVTIIVGIATVVAINTFGSAADSANVDAVRNDVAQIAASAQAQYTKPVALGGAGQDFANVTFKGMAFPGDITDAGTDLVAVNQNGTYVLGGADPLVITAYPSSDPGYTGNPESSKGGSVTAATATTGGGSFTFTVTKDQIDLTTDYTPGGSGTTP